MMKYFLRYLMFAFTMFAAAPVDLGGGGSDLGDTGGGDAGAGGGDFEADTGGDIDPAEGGQESVDPLGEVDPDAEKPPVKQEDPDTADLKGLVSRRLVALKKDAPELAAIFQKYPKVQEQIEAAFRRDMGYRELGTIADFRAFREEFPGGLQDVQQLRTELQEVEQLDQNFYGKDATGNYSGHSNLIQNLYNDDRTAAVALFKTMPREWARLDPESYNEVMGAVVGATLRARELPEWLGEIGEAAKDPKNLPVIQRELAKIQQWAQSYNKQPQAQSEQEKRLQQDRQRFQTETQQRQAQDTQRFKESFFSESKKQQTGIVRTHPAVKELLASKTIPEAKKAEIVGKVQQAILGHLKGSTAYMKKLREAYNSGNLQESLKIEKAQWSYPWVLNKFVRSVLNAETPTMVRQNREKVRGAAPSRQPVRPQQQGSKPAARTEPYKENGNWYSKEGRRLSISEILRGAVPDSAK